jgi:DNA polymerase sigma
MHEIVQDILEKFRALLTPQVPIHRLILFGSRARGDAEPFSDIDVLVVVDSGLDDQIRDLVSDCAWQAGFAKGIVLVPVVFSRDEWERGPERHSLLAKAIEAEGITL